MRTKLKKRFLCTICEAGTCELIVENYDKSPTFCPYDKELRKWEEIQICEEEAMYEKKKAIKEAFKDGDWVFGIGPHEGCSQVFTGSSGDFQPFDYLNDYDPAHFRIATDKEIDEAKNKLI